MAEGKDFLGSLAEETKKPASFQEEKVTRVEKKPVNKGIIAGVIVGALLIGALCYYLFLMPKITMENFVGRTTSEFSAWARQNEIETVGVVMNQQYSNDYEEGIILSQNIEAGTKIKKNAKITLAVSQGADPNELIDFPDLKEMTLSEINAWIKANKLQNTKVSQTYSDEVEEGRVISYDMKNVEEEDFTRGTTLTITVSKGEKAAQTITVSTDYVNKSISLLESWAETNSLKISKTESYSNSVDVGNIISVSVAKGDKVKAGDTINVVVSKGKVSKMIYFEGYTYDEAQEWCMEHGLSVKLKYEYSNTCKKDYLVYQSIPAGTTLTDDYTKITLSVSLGKPDLSGFAGSLDDLKEKISEMNESGANLSIGNITYQINEALSPNTVISCTEYPEVGGKVDVVVSKGQNIWLVDSEEESESGYLITWENLTAYPNAFMETDVRLLLGLNPGVAYQFEYQHGTEGMDDGVVIAVSRSDGYSLRGESYIPENVIVKIVVCDNNQ